MKIFNPFSGEIVGEVEPTSAAQLQSDCQDARDAFAHWRRTQVSERVRLVRAGIDEFRANQEEIAREITLQMGKPITEARHEVDGMCSRAKSMADIAVDSLTADALPKLPGLERRIEHEPLGIVLDLAAWNYPLLIAVNVVVPALLAGNVVLLKHSSKTPLCGVRFAAAFPHVTNLVLGHAETGDLIRSGVVDHVAFTGSVAGGRQVFRSVAESPRFIDTGLELGGVDPAYVAADADLEFAVENLVDGACYNAGQSCCGVERVYVHESLYAEFLERALQRMQAYRLGDPLDEATTMGPMASRAALDVLHAQVSDATHSGARLLCGGAVTGESGQFFEPTLLADCRNDCLVMQEESFGPIMPVAAVANDEDALARMNDSQFGLTASVWTRDRERAERFVTDLETGTVFQNRCDFLDPALPWTGVKDSGKGATLSKYGFLHLTRRKSVHLRDG